MRERWIQADFFVIQHRLVGSINPGKDRLSDYLNDALQSSILLRDVQVTRMAHPNDPPLHYEYLTVMKDKLCFILLFQERAGLAGDWIFHPVAKFPQPFTLSLEFYEISGTVYLQGRGDPISLFMQETSRFVPVVEPRIVLTLHPQVSFGGKVAIVNRPLVHLIAAETGER